MIKTLVIGALAGYLALASAPTARAAEIEVKAESAPYRLRLYHLHTGEHLDVVYRVGEKYLPDRISELNHFLRDHRTGDVRTTTSGNSICSMICW